MAEPIYKKLGTYIMAPEPVSTAYFNKSLPLIGLLYHPRMIDQYEAFGGMRIGRGNKYQQKTCPSATLSTTNPTSLGLGT
jgi:hypothetical protein